MVHGRVVDGAEDAVGHVRWARDLQEMPAWDMRSSHRSNSLVILAVGGNPGCVDSNIAASPLGSQ
jgi:hypothetical protein